MLHPYLGKLLDYDSYYLDSLPPMDSKLVVSFTYFSFGLVKLETFPGECITRGPTWQILQYYTVVTGSPLWVRLGSVRPMQKDRQKAQVEVFFLILLTLKLVQQKPTHICHKKLASENHLRKNRKQTQVFFPCCRFRCTFLFWDPP